MSAIDSSLPHLLRVWVAYEALEGEFGFHTYPWSGWHMQDTLRQRWVTYYRQSSLAGRRRLQAYYDAERSTTKGACPPYATEVT